MNSLFLSKAPSSERATELRGLWFYLFIHPANGSNCGAAEGSKCSPLSDRPAPPRRPCCSKCRWPLPFPKLCPHLAYLKPCPHPGSTNSLPRLRASLARTHSQKGECSSVYQLRRQSRQPTDEGRRPIGQHAPPKPAFLLLLTWKHRYFSSTEVKR